jgi:hypothetical protein
LQTVVQAGEKKAGAREHLLPHAPGTMHSPSPFIGSLTATLLARQLSGREGALKWEAERE